MKFTHSIAILFATSVLAAPVADPVTGVPSDRLTGADATIQGIDTPASAAPEAPKGTATKGTLPKLGGNRLGQLVSGKALNDPRAFMAAVDAAGVAVPKNTPGGLGGKGGLPPLPDLGAGIGAGVGAPAPGAAPGTTPSSGATPGDASGNTPGADAAPPAAAGIAPANGASKGTGIAGLFAGPGKSSGSARGSSLSELLSGEHPGLGGLGRMPNPNKPAVAAPAPAAASERNASLAPPVAIVPSDAMADV